MANVERLDVTWRGVRVGDRVRLAIHSDIPYTPPGADRFGRLEVFVPIVEALPVTGRRSLCAHTVKVNDGRGVRDYPTNRRGIDRTWRVTGAPFWWGGQTVTLTGERETLTVERYVIDAAYISEMLDAYVGCALWSSMDWADDSGGEPIDANYGRDDITAATLAEMLADCQAFARDNARDLSGIEPGQAGHDFWLTRNGHGAGFWDRGLGDRGDRLTAACRPYGSVDLYVTDDGSVAS